MKTIKNIQIFLWKLINLRSSYTIRIFLFAWLLLNNNHLWQYFGDFQVVNIAWFPRDYFSPSAKNFRAIFLLWQITLAHPSKWAHGYFLDGNLPTPAHLEAVWRMSIRNWRSSTSVCSTFVFGAIFRTKITQKPRMSPNVQAVEIKRFPRNKIKKVLIV